jgi:hypothetical protein
MRAAFAAPVSAQNSCKRQTAHSKPSRLPLRIIFTEGIVLTGVCRGETGTCADCKRSRQPKQCGKRISGRLRRLRGCGYKGRTTAFEQSPRMAAKKRVPPPQPIPNRTWQQLTKAEQSAAYSAALLAYSRGTGPNPQTRGEFFRAKANAPAFVS